MRPAHKSCTRKPARGGALALLVSPLSDPSNQADLLAPNQSNKRARAHNSSISKHHATAKVGCVAQARSVGEILRARISRKEFEIIKWPPTSHQQQANCFSHLRQINFGFCACVHSQNVCLCVNGPSGARKTNVSSLACTKSQARVASCELRLGQLHLRREKMSAARRALTIANNGLRAL